MRNIILAVTGAVIIHVINPHVDEKLNRDNMINNANQLSTHRTESAVTLVTPIPASWLGKYSAYFKYADIAGQPAGWELEINITKDKITAKGEGFQMAFEDELKATAVGSKLILTHFKNVSGYTSGRRMKPEFTLINDHGKFYIQSKWIASGDVVEQPTALGYKIERAKR